ncbi:MAG: TolC family protein [Deltaproteobacteria bacterium]|nr:TolC family protein [Deltaproteobacteria bacterium]
MSRPRLTLLLALSVVPLLAARPARADEVLDLRDALRRALAGNHELQRTALDLDAAGARLGGARGQFDFVLGADFQAKQTRTPERFPSEINLTDPMSSRIDFMAGTQTDLTGSLRLMRALESGGQVALALSATRTDSTSALTSGALFGSTGGSTAPTSFWQVPITLTVSHPLWKNLGPALATIQVRRAALLRDLEALRRARTATDLVRDVVTAYWDLAYQSRDLDIRRGALRLAEDQLQQTRELIAVGRAAPLDLHAVQAAIADRDEQVLLGETLLLEASLRLRRLCGEPPSSGLLRAAPPPPLTERVVVVDSLLQRALQQNPSLLVLRHGTRLQELDVQAAENSLRPQLDFTGSFGALGRKTEFVDSLREAFKFSSLSFSAGLSFTLPLQNRAARGNAAAARLQLKRGRVEIAELEAVTAEAVIRLAAALRVAARRVEVTRGGARAATGSLQAERARFDAGRATNHDLLRRQEELSVAQLREARAVIDYLRAEAALDAVTGENLDRHGLALQPAR